MRRRNNQGSALLAVLWLSAALSVIAFSLANTVRGEIERSSTAVDGLRTQYLAEAGIERGILYIEWARENRMPPNIPFRYSAATPVLPFSFPGGQVLVEVAPETARMNLNSSPPNDLMRLILAMGVDPDRAAQIVTSIVAQRTPGQAAQMSALNASLAPSFRRRPASFQETEELMAVPGMTPDLYYGGYNRDAEGRLVPRSGLKDCVSVFGAYDRFDVNTAQPPVLAAIGLSPEAVAAIVARRRMLPFKGMQELTDLAAGSGPALGRLRIGGNSIFTLRSTARTLLPNGRLSDLERTAAATVKFLPLDENPKLQILRWYDNAWTP
ncbi:MAG: general secretion pathway protein GspK [Acidobacteriia bacterium]|nr:general secretion pathway protein GspK [Terriglobia bacterium]